MIGMAYFMNFHETDSFSRLLAAVKGCHHIHRAGAVQHHSIDSVVEQSTTPMNYYEKYNNNNKNNDSDEDDVQQQRHKAVVEDYHQATFLQQQQFKDNKEQEKRFQRLSAETRSNDKMTLQTRAAVNRTSADTNSISTTTHDNKDSYNTVGEQTSMTTTNDNGFIKHRTAVLSVWKTTRQQQN
jgi:hypothetical protein